MSAAETAVPALAAPLTKADFLTDYRLAWESRHASLAGRKEVFMGKAKFGIFGDGKEVPQLAMARAFQDGDFRAGYYRDQTFMAAIGQLPGSIISPSSTPTPTWRPSPLPPAAP